MWECALLLVLALLAVVAIRRFRERFGINEKLPMYQGTFNAILGEWDEPGGAPPPLD